MLGNFLNYKMLATADFENYNMEYEIKDFNRYIRY